MKRLGTVAAVTCTALGLVAVTALALVGHGTTRVVASGGTQHPGVPVTPVTTTTTGKAVTTTSVSVAWKAPPATALPTTLPPTTRPPTTRPPTTRPPTTFPPTTRPPTTSAPRTTTTVGTMARFQISPSVARFPSLPPPYWPMPIVAVTITNAGGATIRAIVVHPVGVYSVPSSTCSTLSPGQSCVAKVQFCPSSPNQYADTLLVTGQNATTGAPLQTSIALEGTAT